jgi:hypothetical protein
MENDTAQIYQEVHEFTFEQQQAQDDMLLGIQRESERTNRDPLNGMLLAPIGGESDGVIPPPSPTHLYDSGEQDKEQEENPEGRSQEHALDPPLDSDGDEGRLTAQTLDVTSPGMINVIHTRALGVLNTSSTTAGGRPVNIGSQRRSCVKTAVLSGVGSKPRPENGMGVLGAIDQER